jgi:hypothetical protein
MEDRRVMYGMLGYRWSDVGLHSHLLWQVHSKFSHSGTGPKLAIHCRKHHLMIVDI